MSDLSDIREGIKTVLEANVAGLRVYTYPVTPYHTPCIQIGLDEFGEVMTFDGDTHEVQLDMTLYVNSGRPDQGGKELDEYKSPSGAKSIRAAIEADPTLDSKADGAQVGWPQPFEDEPVARQYACVFPIVVLFQE